MRIIKTANVKKVSKHDLELDFGPNWGYLIIPIKSKVNKKLNLKKGDKVDITFKKEVK